jgi:uncharacterized membrane protein
MTQNGHTVTWTNASMTSLLPESGALFYAISGTGSISVSGTFTPADSIVLGLAAWQP